LQKSPIKETTFCMCHVAHMTATVSYECCDASYVTLYECDSYLYECDSNSVWMRLILFMNVTHTLYVWVTYDDICYVTHTLYESHMNVVMRDMWLIQSMSHIVLIVICDLYIQNMSHNIHMWLTHHNIHIYRSLLQNVVSFIGLFCKRDL